MTCGSCSSKSGYLCPDLSRVGIWNSPVKLRHSHPIRDSWTLCLDSWGVRRQAPPEKFRNLRFSKCWKCVEIVNPTITALYLGHLQFFTVPSGGPFWLLGGCMRTPCTPLPIGLLNTSSSRTILNFYEV